MAILDKPQLQWQEPFKRHVDKWDDRVARGKRDEDVEGQPMVAPMTLNNRRCNRVPMSILMTTTKKQTSKKKHIRLKIVRKIKTALSLVVIRGAEAKEVKGKMTLVLNEEEAKTMGDKWILVGWSYIFQPTLNIYRMSYSDIIRILRTALRGIWDQGARMEEMWAADQLTDQKQKTVKLRPAFRLASGSNGRSVETVNDSKDGSSHVPANKIRSHNPKSKPKSPISSDIILELEHNVQKTWRSHE